MDKKTIETCNGSQEVTIYQNSRELKKAYVKSRVSPLDRVAFLVLSFPRVDLNLVEKISRLTGTSTVRTLECRGRRISRKQLNENILELTEEGYTIIVLPD